jgi:zinc protease
VSAFGMTTSRALAFVGLLAGCFFAALPSAGATTVERVISPGGIEAWLVHDKTVPMIAVEYAFRGGGSQDPADKPGLAHLLTTLLDEGAGDLKSAAFQQKMEDKAIKMSWASDRDDFRGSLRTLSDRKDAAFDLLRLALTSPRFDADAIERMRTQLAAQLRRESVDPNQLASNAWWAAAFPGHPYGRPPKGTLESLAKLNVDDLRTYVAHVFARDNLKVAVVGDIDAAAVGQMLDRVFGALPAKAQLAVIPQATLHGVGDINVIDLDVPQATVSFGGVGLPRKHPDFVTAYVVNHILGGGSFTSRLYQEVREKRGLAYGVSTFLYPMDEAALVMGWTATRSDKTKEAIDIIQKEAKRFAADGPTAEELAQAKDYLVGSYALRFDSSSKIARQLVQIQLDDLGIDYINHRNAQIEAVTLDDAKRVARTLFEGGYLTTVVGRPKGMSTGQRG